MTKLSIVKYLEDTYDENNEHQVRGRITCNDGFSISVQGGTRFHYCSPREKCNEYIEVELGFPSDEEELLKDYAENPIDLMDSVYGYVPIELVEQVILKHGGLKCLS